MANPYLLLLSCLTSLSLYAQIGNFGFEQRAANGQPVSWNSLSDDYLFALDSSDAHSGRYALLVAHKNSGTFGGSHLRIPATFAGKKITLKAFVKTKDTGIEPNTYAGLWMRIDDAASKALAFDNMASRGIKGTSDWQPHIITLSIPDEAASIHLGSILVGKGAAWFDDFELTVDGTSVDIAPLKVVKLLKAQTDTAFANGSGIELNTLTKQQIDNLDLLGNVWGFIKYYHPAVAEGNHNMDAELFRVMPAVLKATSADQRSEVLMNWIATFGPVQATGKETDTPQATQKPDLAWLTDVARLGKPLQAQLTTIRQAKRPTKSYYVSLVPQVGNPEFRNELPYRRMTTPDAGYRLLSLYRYWNIIQYFFPYKHLIGEDWNKVLPSSIPAFVVARDSLSYRLAALSLIGRIHDTHANLWGDPIIRKDYKGTFFSPVQVRYIENQFVVTNFFNDSLGKVSGLQRGDAVTSVDGVSTSSLVQQRKPYYPASNEPTQLRDISRDLLAGQTNTVQIGIERAGKTQMVVVNRYKSGQAQFSDRIDYSSYPKDSCYQLLHPDIGYLFLGNIKANKLPDIMRLFKDTKGLVIDMRCYPSEFVVFSLGKYLTEPKLFAKFTVGSIETPGLFRWQSPILVGERNARDAYKGKVVVLVNELTQSSAEYHTMAFQQAPAAVVLGSTTAAADGNVSPFYLPGGLQTMISGIGVNYPDGRETQRIGVGVDLEMHPTRRGIESGRDELLEKAVTLIREGK